jgi:prepilin-type N-terminal cleavage/methylation domain-containing protein
MRRQEVLKGARDRSDAGMTLVELLIALLISSIVLAIAATTLFSLSQTANRVDSRVTDEQDASTVLAQVSRDIRSSHQVTFVAFVNPAPTQELELQMNQPNGQWVEWVYTPTTTTVNGVTQSANALARYVASSASGPFSVSAPAITTPVDIANGTTTALFRYFQNNGTELIPNGNESTIQTCTTRVMVTLDVATQKNLAAVPTFRLTDDVAITDQEAQWATTPCSS